MPGCGSTTRLTTPQSVIPRHMMMPSSIRQQMVATIHDTSGVQADPAELVVAVMALGGRK
jgi:hypothetical protein